MASLFDGPYRSDKAAYQAAYYKANKAAIKAKRALHKAQNEEAIRERKAQSRARRKNKIRESSAAYYQKNKAIIDARNRAYFAAHPEAKRSYDQNRRSRLIDAEGSISKDLLARLRVLQKGRCANCSSDCSVSGELDHITPLALGGKNIDENIQLLCRSCNRKKHSKDPLEWAAQNGRLL